eukprot:2168241-Pyramimonas_sp.AAC.1
MTDLTAPGAPCYFMHGAKCVNIPSVFHAGLSCRGGGTLNGRGEQFIRGCPYLPGDNRAQSGLRIDLEVLIMVRLE